MVTVPGFSDACKTAAFEGHSPSGEKVQRIPEEAVGLGAVGARRVSHTMSTWGIAPPCVVW
jgi:hypothetical protein